MSNNSSQETNEPRYQSHQMNILFFAIDNAMNEMCASVKVEEFRELMETINDLKQKHSKIYKLFDSFKKSLVKNFLTELHEIFEEDGLDKSFCNYNESCKKYTNSTITPTPSWRPSGNAFDDIRAQILLIKLKQKSLLELYLKEKEESIVNLKNKVSVMRLQAQEMDNKIVELDKSVNERSDICEEKLKSLRTSCFP